MPPDEATPGMLPPRVQRLLAAVIAASLTGMAVAFITMGGFSGGLVHHDAAPGATGGFSVSVNTASTDELAVLPGLGPSTAAAIVRHRREHGPFVSLDDLLDVPGIGPATLEGIRPHLRPIRRREPTP